MKLSIIIPVYNENKTIQTVVESVRSVELSVCESKEIIVVDDCSTDGTKDKLLHEIHSMVDKIIFHEKNKGKGAAIRSGISQATGDVIVVQDADLEYDPSEYSKLIRPILEDKADVVYGSRFIGNDAHRVLYFWHYMGNKFLTLLSNMFSNLNLTDMETCYKMFKREIIQGIKLEQNRFGFEPEITAKIAKIKNCRIYEVGISYHGRTYQEGKKLIGKTVFQQFGVY